MTALRSAVRPSIKRLTHISAQFISILTFKKAVKILFLCIIRRCFTNLYGTKEGKHRGFFLFFFLLSQGNSL